jgi:hypothetical protein
MQISLSFLQTRRVKNSSGVFLFSFTFYVRNIKSYFEHVSIFVQSMVMCSHFLVYRLDINFVLS